MTISPLRAFRNNIHIAKYSLSLCYILTVSLSPFQLKKIRKICFIHAKKLNNEFINEVFFLIYINYRENYNLLIKKQL